MRSLNECRCSDWFRDEWTMTELAVRLCRTGLRKSAVGRLCPTSGARLWRRNEPDALRPSGDGAARLPKAARIGTHDVKDKTIQWESTAIFRFEHGRIAEEWVSRDELGMLLDAGVLRRGDDVR